MAYVEMLRARRVLVCFAIILAVILVLVLLSGRHHVMIDHNAIPLSAILGAASIGPMLVVAFLASGLNAEHATTAILWTRPLARAAIAWRYVAVDMGALVVAYALTLVAALAGMASLGVLSWVQADAHSLVTVPLALACPAMLYGWIQLISARLPGRAGAVAGGLWFAMLVLTPLLIAPFPPLLHDVIRGLDYLNPLIWLGSHGREDGATLIALSTGWRALGAALIALVALVVSIQLWSTREV